MVLGLERLSRAFDSVKLGAKAVALGAAGLITATVAAPDEAKAVTVDYNVAGQIRDSAGLPGVSAGDEIAFAGQIEELGKVVTGRIATFNVDGQLTFTKLGTGTFTFNTVIFNDRVSGQDLVAIFADPAAGSDAPQIGGQSLTTFNLVLPKDGAFDGLNLSDLTLLQGLQLFAAPDDNGIITVGGIGFADVNRIIADAEEHRVQAVPLPAAGTLLLGALGVLGGVAARRRGANAGNDGLAALSPLGKVA